MQLRKIRVKNVLSLEDVTVELSSGLTVLVGRGESGKTALIRSILTVFTNSDSKFRVRKGTTQCEAALFFDNGLEVIWQRKQGKSSGSTSYLIDGELYTKMGRNVPEEVARIASPWIVGGKNFGFVQVQEQNPPPFLTTEMTAKTGRAWDHLEGRVYREALDACKITIRGQVSIQSSCLKKLNFYKDHVDEEMEKLDDLYISSQKCVRLINALYDLLLFRRLETLNKVSSVLELLQKAYAGVLIRKLQSASILRSGQLLEEVLEFQKGYVYGLVQKAKSFSSSFAHVKTVSHLLKVVELRSEARVCGIDLATLLSDQKFYDEELTRSLDCPFYKETGTCVLLENMLG